MSKITFAKLVLLLILTAFCAMDAKAQSQMTHDKVITSFQRFSLSVVGDPKSQSFIAHPSEITPSATAEYHKADKDPYDLTNSDFDTIFDNHPHPYWHIKQRGDFDAEIDDSTGHIINYIDESAISADTFPAGEAISKFQARQIAEAALRAAGAPLGSYAFAYAQERQNFSPPTASGHEWYISWTRTFQGIPFRRVGAGVFLSAETGKVISVRVDEQSVDPPTVSDGITQEQARSVAEAQLNAVGLAVSDLPIVTVQKEVVPFNHFWELGDVQHHSLQTRVVWNFHYGVPLDTIEVWVDVETGDVVGGDYEGTLGNGVKIPKPKFGHQMKYKELAVKGK